MAQMLGNGDRNQPTDKTETFLKHRNLRNFMSQRGKSSDFVSVGSQLGMKINLPNKV